MDPISTVKTLAFLTGTWKGLGRAEFPTIRPIEYTEELVFSKNEKDPVLHYEQKTWIRSNDEKNGQPIFWESGFIIAKDDGQYELVNAQKSGRMEILRGRLRERTDGVLLLNLESVEIRNDERMVRSARYFEFSPRILKYELKMSTKTNPDFSSHLRASLDKK